jgi:tRNA (guanine-N7-)-methyltransferase
VSSPADDGERSTAPIRSYVLRRSHFSPAQRQAYERLMPVFGVPYRPAPLNLPEVFGREAETVLEIGFGMGDTTAEIAAANPTRDYLAVDVHTPGVGALLKLVEAQRLTNIRIIEHDAREVVEHQIPDDYLTGINVFFPDPWPKARHHKRRLIRTQFVHTLATKLRVGGFLHLATDWPDYAEQMMAAVNETPALRRLAGTTDLPVAGPERTPSPPLPANLPVRPSTRFEKRGQRLGHPIADIVAIRRAGMVANI